MADEDKDLAAFEAKYNEIIPESRPPRDMSLVEESSDEEDFVDPREPAPKDDVEEDAPQEEQESGKETEAPSEAEADEDEYEDIPDNQIEAGRALGLSDDEIVDWAENHPDRLKALVDRVGNKPAAQATQPVQEQAMPEVKPAQSKMVHFKFDEDDDPEPASIKLAEAYNKLVDQVNSGFSGVQEAQAAAAKLQQSQFDSMIDGFFDRAESLPAVGKSGSLTERNLAARKEIFTIARVLDGDTWDSKLGKAVKAYQGLHGQEDSVNTLRRKLNKAKTKFSPRPSGRKGKRKVYKNEEERVMAKFDEAADRLGIEFRG